MKRKTFLGKLIATIILSVFIHFSFFGQADINNTPGEVTFTVKTVTANGNFAPRHVLAIWVEDAQGFVKTKLLRASQRKQYLYTWRSVSGDNVIDATTGATLTSHQTHTVIWDCTDVDGNVVPDGDYTIRAEFTEKHAQGPLTAVTFTKGTEEQHLTPADEDHFINISLDYIPETTGTISLTENKLLAYPNPGKGIFRIKLTSDGPYDMNIFDINCNNAFHQAGNAPSHEVRIDLSRFKSGIYFVLIKQGKNVSIARVVKQ